MYWKNLNYNKCPKCGSDIEANARFVRCAKCEFVCSLQKAKIIIADRNKFNAEEKIEDEDDVMF